MHEETYTIVGIVGDYPYASVNSPIGPLVIFFFETHPAIFTRRLALRLHVPVTPQVVALFTERLTELTQDRLVFFSSLADTYADFYKETRLFCNSVWGASVIMVRVTLLGLLGYVADEVQWRRKEIAIRQINGATVGNILWLIGRHVFFTALPAMVVGGLVAYVVGRRWMEQFMVRVPLSWGLFAACGAGILLVVFLCMLLRTCKVARENPFYSLKSE